MAGRRHGIKAMIGNSAKNANNNDDVSEMAIVDTFTKLIFGEDDQYDASELAIIQALRDVDANVALDTPSEMGAYLQALGVREMIALVSRVRGSLAAGLALPTGSLGTVTGHPHRLF